MQIKIATRHGSLSDASQEKVAAKLEKLTRFFDRLTSLELTIDLEHVEAPQVDLQVSAEHKHDFVATETAGELMAAIDGVIHKLEQQIKRYKQKVQDHHREPGLRQQSVAPTPEPEEI